MTLRAGRIYTTHLAGVVCNHNYFLKPIAVSTYLPSHCFSYTCLHSFLMRFSCQRRCSAALLLVKPNVRAVSPLQPRMFLFCSAGFNKPLAFFYFSLSCVLSCTTCFCEVLLCSLRCGAAEGSVGRCIERIM